MRDYDLQYINLLSLSDKESVIVSSFVPVQLQGRRERLKQSRSSKDSHGWVRENVFGVGIAGMAVRKNREVKNCWSIEKASVSWDRKDGFVNK